jgi:tRNA uridine 5-carboxymethylaminomethyl modification enzyme
VRESPTSDANPVANYRRAPYANVMHTAYDIIVIGTGHAGCEAAAAAARLGCRVAAVTFQRAHVGRLSCNPAIGGLAKGHLVRELDALGGLMARVADASTIQFRMLNTRKGLAVRSSRAQVDIHRYPAAMAAELARVEGLDILEAEVAAILTERDQVTGVTLADGTSLTARAVILTTGTFLGGLLHRGEEQTLGGRTGDGAAHALADSLRHLGLPLQRLKTGTVPRLDGRTVPWERFEAQEDVEYGRFSHQADRRERLPRITCALAYTNPAVHDLLRANADRSPMFTGVIQGRGPRYCPSIEDKVVRFADRDRHLLFLEPEGLNTDRVYVNGLSTSMPADIQEGMIRAIDGLQDVTILEYGYAVEYDAIDPTVLGHDLQHKQLRGLYFAGQVNGTSGYEEAAVQGFIAGVSAARDEPFVLGRDQAYIGVLVDDLVSKGVGGEPYRMFTSRAEHRLLLREDNADQRLMPTGRELGLVDDTTWQAYLDRQAAIDAATEALHAFPVNPSDETLAKVAAAGWGVFRRTLTGADWLKRPDATYAQMAEVFGLPALEPEVAESVEIRLKYAGYIKRSETRAKVVGRMEHVALPENLPWNSIEGLTVEVQQRLAHRQPGTLGQAARVPGVTPAAVDVIAGWVTRARAGGRYSA